MTCSNRKKKCSHQNKSDRAECPLAYSNNYNRLLPRCPSATRHQEVWDSWIGVSPSPLRPVLGNGEPLIELLGNALAFERVLQRPPLSHLWATGRPRMRYPARQQLPWRPAHVQTFDVAS